MRLILLVSRFVHGVTLGDSHRNAPVSPCSRLYLFGIVAVGLVGLAPHAHAQTVADPATLDVAGVHLGMTHNEALSALKAFDPDGTIEDFDIPKDGKVGNRVFTSKLALSLFSKDFTEVKRLPLPKCTNPIDCDQIMVEAWKSVLKTPRVITVWFSATPHAEKVIAISESLVFVQAAPSVDTLRDGLFQKYGSNYTTSTGDDRYDLVLSWRFDPRGRPVPKAVGGRLPHLGLTGETNYICSITSGNYMSTVCPAQYLPDMFYAGEGPSLIARIQRQGRPDGVLGSAQQSGLVASNFVVVLSNSSDLYKYQAEATARDNGAQAAQDKAAADQTTKTAPKF